MGVASIILGSFSQTTLKLSLGREDSSFLITILCIFFSAKVGPSISVRLIWFSSYPSKFRGRTDRSTPLFHFLP